MSVDLIITTEKLKGFVLVTLSGELDIYTSQKLKEKLYAIIEAENCDMRIDCSALEYIDSTGLGIFVGVLKKARQINKNIFIRNLRDNIKKLFIITGLDKLFILE